MKNALGLLAALALAALVLPRLGTRRPRSAELITEPFVWTALPTTGFVSGRLATQEDVRADLAAFATESASGATPLAIAVPQYAMHNDSAQGVRRPVIVIQAERAGPMEIIGYRDLQGKVGAGLRQEFELLGTTMPTGNK